MIGVGVFLLLVAIPMTAYGIHCLLNLPNYRMQQQRAANEKVKENLKQLGLKLHKEFSQYGKEEVPDNKPKPVSESNE